jgi:hypothetical protein
MSNQYNVLHPDSEEEKQRFIDLYTNQKIPGMKIAKLLGINFGTVYHKLHRYGIKTRKPTESNRKYTLNESYLDIIDSHDKAQVLGLWYADGCIKIPGDYSCKQFASMIALSDIDENYLIDIKNKFNTDAPLTRTDLNSKNKNQKDSLRLTLCGQKTAENFIKLGCMPNKTFLLKFPTEDQVPSQFLSSFVRGIFEGDGCLYISEKRKEAEFSIVGTLEICHGLRDLFWKELKITSKISKRHKEIDSNNFTFKVSGNWQILKLMKWIYSDYTFKMERKYEKYLILVKMMDGKELTYSSNYKNMMNERYKQTISVFLEQNSHLKEQSV